MPTVPPTSTPGIDHATTHSQPGFAYQIGEVTISGDTEASDEIAALADGSRVLVHDCAFHDDDRTSHGTPGGIARAYADLAVDQIYLTHLYPETAARAASIRSRIDEAVAATVHVGSDLEATVGKVTEAVMRSQRPSTSGATWRRFPSGRSPGATATTSRAVGPPRGPGASRGVLTASGRDRR